VPCDQFQICACKKDCSGKDQCNWNTIGNLDPVLLWDCPWDNPPDWPDP
jgi:hypothetical protein